MQLKWKVSKLDTSQKYIYVKNISITASVSVCYHVTKLPAVKLFDYISIEDLDENYMQKSAFHDITLAE